MAYVIAMARVEDACEASMIEKLKAPFWFGLPGYAWLVGGLALAGGAVYFLFFRGTGSSTATASPQTTQAASGMIDPYASGGGTPVPPTNPIDPNGQVPPTDPNGWGGSGAHDPLPPAVASLSEHEKEWLKLHPGYTVTYERAHGL